MVEDDVSSPDSAEFGTSVCNGGVFGLILSRGALGERGDFGIFSCP